MDNANNPVKEILNYKLIDFGNISITTEKLIVVVLIIIITKLLLVAIRRSILKSKKFKPKDQGSLFSMIQIFKYIGWVIAIILILDTIGVKITVLLTGSAALLVGVGIGLQQTFNDFVSGVILLLEGKTKVGDVLQFDNDIVMLKEIGLRTSEGVNRDNVIIIIPNSKIINDKVINWSHQKNRTRFRINIGVAYGSDVDLVCKILEQSAMEHPDVYVRETVEARFIDFGDSSLNFELLFYSRNIFRIEKVKSDIRKIINRNFLKHNITIPFPQMDVHLKDEKKSESKT